MGPGPMSSLGLGLSSSKAELGLASGDSLGRVIVVMAL
jgi:hypothetical protein